jgi:hypothetical protein
MAPITPYSPELAGRDPLVVMHETIPAIAAAVKGWTADRFERRYAPGKWTARQLLIHLVHSELALGTRVRMALTSPNFLAQSFDQNRWMEIEQGYSGPGAATAFGALAAMNLALYESLSDADRGTTLTHSEYGQLTVDWIIHQQAGHHVHHLKHLAMLDVPV